MATFEVGVENHINVSAPQSNEKPGWLGYTGDYTTQLYRDFENLQRLFFSNNSPKTTSSENGL